MKKIYTSSAILFLFCFLLLNVNLYAQTSGIQWQNTIGGTNDDKLWRMSPATDGGILCFGFSKSGLTGDKTEAAVGAGFMDYWVIKLDSTGNILWQNTIGGSKDDYCLGGEGTSDGGAILIGHSNSPISGDKTEGDIGGLSNPDYWVIKLDNAGSIVWQNTIGGSFADYGEIIRETSDGGYIAGGYSFSGISGDKTEANHAGVGLPSDIWILKLNSTGGIVWQNTIGGTNEEQFSDVIETSDGGYLVAAESYSDIGGDKSENSQGSFDNWLIKLDASGNIVWENTIGGNLFDYIANVVETSTGDFIVGGRSTSVISGDKTEYSNSNGDCWVYKIDNLGNIIWQNTIGGSTFESLNAVTLTSDDGVLLAVESNSSVSGDKDEGIVAGTATDYWLLKLNSSGSYCWQETMGGNAADVPRGIYELDPTHFIVGGYSFSGIAGDKTEINIGGGTTYPDYWVIKVESDILPLPEICNGFDDDCDGFIDDGVVETITISAGGPTTFCQGGTVLLTAAYSGTSVQWKKDGANIPGAISSTYIVTKKATYTCTTTSACGSATSGSIYVNIQKNPNAIISAGGATTFCLGDSVILTANSGAGVTYQWYKGATAIAGATSINYTATKTGNYRCRLTKIATGCYKNSNQILVTVTCREEEEENLQLSVFPNPVTNRLTITLNSKLHDKNSIIITDISGNVIYESQLNSISQEIDVSYYAAGVYFIRFNNGDTIVTEKFIKE